jgi:hypothetical protein
VLATQQERAFSLGQRGVSGFEFVVQLGLLALEDGSRDGLLGEPHIDQRVLLGLQGANELGLGLAHLRHGLLRDGD